MFNAQYFSTRGCANGNATSTLLYETLRVACFSGGVRQISGQRVAQYKSVQVPNAPYPNCILLCDEKYPHQPKQLSLAG
ncbi:MAG: hypothetical protein ACYTXA_01845 [Nostoc sp.]